MSDVTDYWTGPGGEKWAKHHEAIDHSLSNITDAWLATIAPTGRIVDIGCGCGETTRRLAAKASHVLGVDISRPLLDIARAGGGNFVEADATTYPFEPVDLVASRFGVMFFDDPVAAFANLRTASRRLSCVVWRAARDNEWVVGPLAAIRDLVPPAPAFDPNGPGLFSLADDARIRDILSRAGFEHVEIARHDTTMKLGATVDEALAHLSATGPLSRVLATVDPATQAKVLERARAVVRPELGASVWFVTSA